MYIVTHVSAAVSLIAELWTSPESHLVFQRHNNLYNALYDIFLTLCFRNTTIGTMFSMTFFLICVLETRRSLQYTVISWLRGEQSNYCPEVVEKIWETVARGRRPRATVSQIFSITEGQWFDCSPSSLEITVLLPNCLKHRNTVNNTPILVVDVGRFDVTWRHLSRDQSIVHYSPVNSFNCSPLAQKLQNYRVTVKNV